MLMDQTFAQIYSLISTIFVYLPFFFSNQTHPKKSGMYSLFNFQISQYLTNSYYRKKKLLLF
jgi:hypothetical protein